MNNTDRMDELLTLAIRDLIRKEWEDMASADVSEVKKNPKFRRMQKKVTTMIRNGPGKDKKPYRSKRKRWLPALIAAGLLLLLLAAPVIAAAMGEADLVEILHRLGIKLSDIPYDTPVEYEEVTLIRRKDVKWYSGVDEMLENENLSVLLPTWMPENFKIRDVSVVKNGEEVRFSFETIYDYFIASRITPEYKLIKGADMEKLTIDGTETEVVFYSDNDRTGALFAYDDYEYNISAEDKEQLIRIIQGLKSTKQ